MEREQTHIPDTNRYEFDHTLIPEGFHQLDTEQDAYYYGVWVNPVELKMVEYAEGDLTRTTFESIAEAVGQIVAYKELLGYQHIDDWQLEAAVPIEERNLTLWFDLYRQRRQTNDPGAQPEGETGSV